jgi:hypothetical protein
MMSNESQAVITVTEIAPYRFTIEIVGSDLSLEVSEVMVKFLNDCLQQIHRETKVH